MTAVADHESPCRPAFDRVEDAIKAFRDGYPVLVTDDEHRENEGDVILAASTASPHWIGWAVRHTSGVLCAPMPDEIADRLDLPPMVERNEDPRSTAFTVTVDARRGVGTGISAADRATTLRLLADPSAGPRDLVRPGHIFPLRARAGGVLERPGHTEAAVDLCRLAGLPPVGVLAEIVEDDGTLMRQPGLRALADEHGLPLISIAALTEYLEREGVPAPEVEAVPRVERVIETTLPTVHGRLRALGYRDLLTGDEHLALISEPLAATGALVRLHSECLTGDALGSQRCDCGPQLEQSLARIAENGGAVVYLRGHEGRGIGLLAKLTAYALQDDGLDTVEANTAQGMPVDAREYGAGAAILSDLGLTGVRLLTNNPAKVAGLESYGIEVAEQVRIEVPATPENRHYLIAKRDLMGHLLNVEDARMADQ
jgi:3,4-dihydroxy 2-butanone 4-phosphate synthase/GTP cyclohydrolase II